MCRRSDSRLFHKTGAIEGDEKTEYNGMKEKSGGKNVDQF